MNQIRSSSSPPRLFVVDDEPANVQTLISALTPQYEIEFALSGMEALPLLENSDPDMILLDIMMPQMDGFELLARLRQIKHLMDTPVFFITAYNDPAYESRALQAGAVDFIHKPVNLDVLRARLQMHVQMIESRRQMSELVRQLQASNAELESFSYSVSHDLNAPLRAIQGFSQILHDHYAESFDERGSLLLERISLAASKMGEQINHLLSLSRLNRNPLHCQHIDMSQRCREIIAELQSTEPARQVQIEIADNLQIVADPVQLDVLLANLLSNAWKFTAKTSKAYIEVGRQQHDGELMYFIRDNGAGFDMAFRDKLFMPFQRYHSEDEFPGHGIGLASVQRVINRHQGRIAIEANINQGATFWFTLENVNA